MSPPRKITYEQRLENQKKARQKNPLCNFRSTHSFLERIDNAAKSMDMSRTKFLVYALTRFLDENNL
jgi:hypothetical protein